MVCIYMQLFEVITSQEKSIDEMDWWKKNN